MYNVFDCAVRNLVDALGYCFFYHHFGWPIADEEEISVWIDGVIVPGAMQDYESSDVVLPM
jgi:hypothetical protein